LAFSCLVDIRCSIAKPLAAGRQIVGFSLPPQLAAKVKIRAVRRNISLEDLFAKMWTLYKNTSKNSA
jgi:hypothetical protein